MVVALGVAPLTPPLPFQGGFWCLFVYAVREYFLYMTMLVYSRRERSSGGPMARRWLN
jgi:hypothetical protein